MTTLNNELSLALENMFVLTIASLPNVTLSCNQVTLPGVSVGENVTETPTLDISNPTTKLVYEPLMCRFLVDEDYENWREVFTNFLGYQLGTTSKTDFSLVLPNNHGKGGYSLNFIDGYVLNMDGVDYISGSADASPVTCGLSIRYSNITVTQN